MYKEFLIGILEKKNANVLQEDHPMVKMAWSNHIKNEATWEREEDMGTKYA